jgi:hypothetical protein
MENSAHGIQNKLLPSFAAAFGRVIEKGGRTQTAHTRHVISRIFWRARGTFGVESVYCKQWDNLLEESLYPGIR